MAGGLGEDLSRVNYTVDIKSLALPVVPWPSMTVLSGNPVVRHLPLSRSADGRIDRGVWEISEGIVEDTEVDELNVVIEGRATVEFLDGSGTVIELKPGSFGILQAGVRTRWIVHQRLRKAYQITLA